MVCLFIIAACTLFVAGCTQVASPAPAAGDDAWKSIPLQDVTTGENLTVARFAGTPVIIHAFTVSCPICTRQQGEITRLKASMGNDLAVIGLDIDPGEDPAALLDHVERNGFQGYYVHAPPELTRALVERFGPAVITPASAPVIVICPGGASGILPQGIKSAESLRAAVTTGC